MNKTKSPHFPKSQKNNFSHCVTDLFTDLLLM